MSTDFADQIAGVAALADPIRRALYQYVAAQADAVSRDQAADATGVPRHTVKFHLDKLVEQKLLDTEYHRLSGRRGPGAGRPTKLYRRSARQVTVTLPERRYDLAAHLLAQAIDTSTATETSALQALRNAAAELGHTIGDRWRPDPATAATTAPEAVCAALTAHGYEPRSTDTQITLVNCPFDALAHDHTELVCGMNLVLVNAIAERVSDGALTTRLDPAEDRCCVMLNT